MIVALLVVAAAMAANDFLAVCVVVAEARCRPLLAGLCDAAGDLARVVYLAVGIDSVIKGVSARTAAVLAVMVITSFVTTAVTTRWSARIRTRSTP